MTTKFEPQQKEMTMSQEKQGQRHAEQNQPKEPQGNRSAAEYQNYLKGYNNGKKS